jgi:hypothetical protein
MRVTVVRVLTTCIRASPEVAHHNNRFCSGSRRTSVQASRTKLVEQRERLAVESR